MPEPSATPAPPGTADPPIDPDRMLAMLHVPRGARAALDTLWRLDARLGAVVATTRDPAIGTIRLAWWRDALIRLDTGAPPAEPLLRAAAADLLPVVAGRDLARLAEGWDTIIDGDVAELDAYGRERGGALFALAARLLSGAGPQVEAVGAGWALVDLGWGQRDMTFRAAALTAAGRALATWDGRTSRALRPLGMLAALARHDVAAGPDAPRRQGSAGRVAIQLRHRLLGR